MQPPEQAVLIGDSVSDIEAARTLGVPSVGYANKPGKADALARSGAEAVIERMADLAEALAAVRAPI